MRYIPNTPEDIKAMLASIGKEKIEDLFDDIPREIRQKAIFDVGTGMNEHGLKKMIRNMAAKNTTLDDVVSFMGAGVYEHFIPSFVDQLLLRSEFYTSYTPYQPEISQGTLQAIFEYQSLICELTGMEGANASVYDGATAAAEAANMAVDSTRRKKVLVSKALHPEYAETVKTYAWVQDTQIQEIALQEGITSIDDLEANLDKEAACIIVQYPNFFGGIEDLAKISELAHAHKALVIVVNAEPIALGLLKPPRELGADIVAGEGQSFGNNVGFGGPHLGYIATTEKLIRKIPGRIAGKTKDVDGKTGFVLTLQAREQHIRREKASSNICSNQALCALAASMAMCAIGKEGLKEMANTNIQKAHYAFKQLTAIKGVQAVYPNSSFFNEFVVETSMPAGKLVSKLSKEGILPGVDLGRYDSSWENQLLVCVTELKTKEDIDLLVRKVGEAL